ncbi:MAG: tRNA (adenosine(37)-N6)-threonylcarbamoyltransferase complex dimerization subunit type 1 TsaB [Porticoccaceae bacterium]|nr:tRNA (adenosine(37)-N6)-threonylcarbamoyltransferase complex dimerization subunit type 1 TsaB [Porticoccaceae bacterium]
MVKIIAIDTASSSCSVALSNDGAISVLRESKPRQHIQLILPLVDELLKRSGLSILDIDAISFNQGPGSFTGLRIGMGVVQGLAFGANLQVLPVSTLQSIAQLAIERGLVGRGQAVMPMIDARMNEVYWGVYMNIDGLARELYPDALNIPDDVGASMLNQSTQNLSELVVTAIGVGDGWQFRKRISVRPLVIYEELSSDAEQVLTLAIDNYRRGGGVPVDQVEPLYLRNEISWTKRQRLRQPGN